eukprot:312574_1
MCANEYSEKWIHLTEHTADKDLVSIPSGVNRDNFILIDFNFNWISGTFTIDCIYKYNTYTDIWSKIDGCNDMQDISSFTAALDVKKQILYLVHNDSVREIQLNDINITNHTQNN